MAASIQAWLESARDDLDAAEAMLKTGRWSYVAFMCHQAIAKLLKAAVYQCAAQIPPPTHNLGHLLKKTGLDVPEAMETRILRINPHYVTSRYPDAAGGRPADAYNGSAGTSDIRGHT